MFTAAITVHCWHYCLRRRYSSKLFPTGVTVHCWFSRKLFSANNNIHQQSFSNEWFLLLSFFGEYYLWLTFLGQCCLLINVFLASTIFHQLFPVSTIYCWRFSAEQCLMIPASIVYRLVYFFSFLEIFPASDCHQWH